ncbi:hypothetical protein C2G38_2248472 [Gigaspora rosea]|uniref:DDE-1 domain-containing protein n=1 Tax=Gigaspora rosea TaxID=44941 RepID=A0A397UXJ3_9GLOM|nr:hypothetical protein C2G38_2248472 [Gigaspora rosea]
MFLKDSVKNYLRKEWHIWMAKGGTRKTATRNLCRARISNVCTWVKHAWKAISDEIIIESFRTCKISNDLDKLRSDLEVVDLCDKDSNNNNDTDIEENERKKFIYYSSLLKWKILLCNDYGDDYDGDDYSGDNDNVNDSEDYDTNDDDSMGTIAKCLPWD